MIERIRRMSYVLAYVVATIPLFHYIRDGRILALMVAVVIFTYVMVVLSSVQVAQPILSSEKAKTVLPRWLPDKPKYHKWWLLVRRTLKWHLLLVPPKMGLAVQLTQTYFYSGFLLNTHNIFFRSYSYRSHDFNLHHIVEMPDLQPPIYLLGFLIICCFTILETQFIASTIVFINKCVSKSIIRIILNRIRTAFTIVIVIMIVSQPVSYSIGRIIFWTEIPCRIGFENTLPFEYAGGNWSRCGRQVSETIATAIGTLTGQGVLLSANFMRPLREGWEFSEYCWTDNRLFLLRQTIATMLGVMFYICLIWLNLWFVEDEVQS